MKNWEWQSCALPALLTPTGGAGHDPGVIACSFVMRPYGRTIMKDGRRSGADLLADGGGDLLRTRDDVLGLVGLGNHLQAGLRVGDADEVDLDVHPGRGRRRAGRLRGGAPAARDVAVT